MALPARLTWLSVSQRLPPSPVHPTEKWWKGHDKVKGGKKWTECWEKWLTDSLQAAGNGEWLLSKCPLWGPQCIYACYEVIKLHFQINMKSKCNLFTFSMHFHAHFVYYSSVCVYDIQSKCLFTPPFKCLESKVLHAHNCCMYLIRNTIKTVFFCSPWDGKPDFTEAITPVFNVTWSFFYY